MLRGESSGICVWGQPHAQDLAAGEAGMSLLCPSPAELGAVPVMGLEKMPRACVSSTHLISKPFFLPERGKLSKALAPGGQGSGAEPRHGTPVPGTEHCQQTH